jgi:catechol 2,3-dioxygenase-like lactoylglutathione lyase family enzyme
MKFELGQHSTSLAVKNIEASKAFYETLGFSALEGLGSIEEKWLIMQKDGVTIGLFQDMFESNIITFNPTDARSIYKHLKNEGIDFLTESETLTDEAGPCHFVIADPDGNQILVDQHV